MPGYGVDEATGPPGQAFPWSEIEERLTSARAYWLVTTSPKGRAHAAPVWGAWLDGVLVFDSGRESRKTRDLLRNPEAVVHLDGGENAVILEGCAEEIADRALLERMATTYTAKYDWLFDPDRPPGIVFVFRPRVGSSWRAELGDTATRWRFGSPSDRWRGRARVRDVPAHRAARVPDPRRAARDGRPVHRGDCAAPAGPTR
jgi:general stress protein 26